MEKAQRRRKRNRGVLIHENKKYYYTSESKSSKHFICVEKNCPGRALQSITSGSVTVSQPHSCSVSSVERSKDVALEKLRQLTLSGDLNLKPLAIIRKVLNEMPPEARKLMPLEDSLVKRVRRWAKLEGLVLASSSVESTNNASSEAVASSSSTLEDGQTRDLPQILDSTATADDVSDQLPSKGFMKLRGRSKGNIRAFIDGFMFHFAKNLRKHQQLYTCREAADGCPVTAIVYMSTTGSEEDYEVVGEHRHKKEDKPRSSSKTPKWMTSLKLVDDDGNVIGPASLDDFENVMATPGNRQNDEKVIPTDSNNVGAKDDSVCPSVMDDGDDFVGDFDDEMIMPEPDPPPQTRTSSETTKARRLPETRTSPETTKTRRLPETTTLPATKSGEKCFVCGDDLIVSEALSSNAATFQKACRYLNVRSEKEWFPGRVENSQYYSFCESCSNEITKIQDLYNKIQDIQSLIFKKVETVEKRIADAEIVDNWMAEAPLSSAKRFEGFRKQILINYRNKLKLRREIRWGRKLGQDFEEVQPIPTAQMFISDPAQTITQVISDKHNSASIFIEEEEVPVNVPGASGLGSRQGGAPHDTKFVPSDGGDFPSIPIPEESFAIPDDDGFQAFDDSHEDAISVHSEREVKFDPSTDSNRVEANEESDPDYNVSSDDNLSDPDYNEGGTRKSGRKRGRKKRSTRNEGSQNKNETMDQRSVTKGESMDERSVTKGATMQNPSQIQNTSVKKVTKSKMGSKRQITVHFPDSVMRPDGRIFMEGIEIIKNPPDPNKQQADSESFTCSVCDKILPTFWHIRDHICGHHLGMYKCNVCNLEITTRRGLERHNAMRHAEAGRFECPICGKLFKIELSLRNHRWTHLSEEEKNDPEFSEYKPSRRMHPDRPSRSTNAQTFMCSYCSKSFYRPTSLKRHELTHTNPEHFQIQCQHCGKIYRNKKTFWTHADYCRKKVANANPKTRYTLPCPKCNVRFISRSTRNKHLRRFHRHVKDASLPFSCPKCTRAFSNKPALVAHRKGCMAGGNDNSTSSVSIMEPMQMENHYQDFTGNESAHASGFNFNQL